MPCLSVTPSDFIDRVRDAEGKLSQGRALSRQEQILLLLKLLTGQATRKETGYGKS
jgi:hypothetical protein